jgi:hypothetical protein
MPIRTEGRKRIGREDKKSEKGKEKKREQDKKQGKGVCLTDKKPRKAVGQTAGKYELSDDDREWVARVVAALGPLTNEEREFLALILRKPA